MKPLIPGHRPHGDDHIHYRWWELVGEWTPDNPERIPIIVDFYTPDQGWRGVDVRYDMAGEI